MTCDIIPLNIDDILANKSNDHLYKFLEIYNQVRIGNKVVFDNFISLHYFDKFIYGRDLETNTFLEKIGKNYYINFKEEKEYSNKSATYFLITPETIILTMYYKYDSNVDKNIYSTLATEAFLKVLNKYIKKEIKYTRETIVIDSDETGNKYGVLFKKAISNEAVCEMFMINTSYNKFTDELQKFNKTIKWLYEREEHFQVPPSFVNNEPIGITDEMPELNFDKLLHEYQEEINRIESEQDYYWL
jgi:hypothetical protein